MVPPASLSPFILPRITTSYSVLKTRFLKHHFLPRLATSYGVLLFRFLSTPKEDFLKLNIEMLLQQIQKWCSTEYSNTINLSRTFIKT